MPSARIGMQERGSQAPDGGKDAAVWPCSGHPEGMGRYCRDQASGISRD